MTGEDRAQAAEAGLRLTLRGSVQGVGFRPWIWRSARALGLRGAVRNVAGGVCVEAFGPAEALRSLRALLERPPLAGAAVESVESQPLGPPAPTGFEIAASDRPLSGDVHGVALAPDLPTCSECLAELADPASRRYRYPFIACAGCGPRYTMARALPYDRARTAMADFPLCADCEAEYRRPEDRRFHAEATACPACGPRLRCLAPGGEEWARGDLALARAVAILRDGGTVAVHGVGGFHLACDARDERAVGRLRARKRRARKPLAVMVAGLAEAEKHAVVGDEDRALLASDARPIVLLTRRSDSTLAPSVAPGSPMVGLMLAYTPLHTLLLGDFGGPLVMTSANRSGEPIACRLPGSSETLAQLSDAILAHDREIVAACDDSVVRPAPGGPIVLRRSRGLVPRPIRLARPLRHSVLACGGQWSNTICVARGDRAWMSAHVADLESPASAERLAETVARWLEWLGIEPERVAHDGHPGYESTRFARAFGGARALAVQHHHAHLAAVLGEHGEEGPALGLSWDGTGDGGDGSAWGGELLYGDAGSVRRLATFRPIALAGGERAIREPWRLALVLLDDAFDGAPPVADLELFRHVEPEERERVHALLASPGLCPAAHGVGRYFDAVGSLLEVRPSATFQGELALAVNFLASGRHAVAYAFELDRSSDVWQVDLRPAVRELVGDLVDARPVSEIADRFHATLVAAGGAVVRAALRALGPGAAQSLHPPLVLGGGCFQNPILVEGLVRDLGGVCRVLRPVALPPGDGGLAFGQVLVADAVAEE